MRYLRSLAVPLSLALLAWCVPAAWAAATPDASLVIKDQQFKPSTLSIPAGQRVKIVLKNEDAMPAEFESYDINLEKVVPGGSEVPLYVGPLEPGTYNFFNDFHKSSKGKLIVE